MESAQNYFDAVLDIKPFLGETAYKLYGQYVKDFTQCADLIVYLFHHPGFNNIEKMLDDPSFTASSTSVAAQGPRLVKKGVVEVIHGKSKKTGKPLVRLESIKLNDEGMIVGFGLSEFHYRNVATKFFYALNCALASLGEQTNDKYRECRKYLEHRTHVIQQYPSSVVEQIFADIKDKDELIIATLKEIMPTTSDEFVRLILDLIDERNRNRDTNKDEILSGWYNLRYSDLFMFGLIYPEEDAIALKLAMDPEKYRISFRNRSEENKVLVDLEYVEQFKRKLTNDG